MLFGLDINLEVSAMSPSSPSLSALTTTVPLARSAAASKKASGWLAMLLGACLLSASPLEATWFDGPAELTGTAPEGADLEDVVPPGLRQAWDATVPIETQSRSVDRFGGHHHSQGSGVIVALHEGELLIATSAHVVPCPVACRVNVGLSDGADGRIVVPARILWRRDDHDLALLAAPMTDGAKIETLALGSPIEGDGDGPIEVFALGYPDPRLLDASAPRHRRERLSVGLLIERRSDFGAVYGGSAASPRGPATGRLRGSHALLHTAPLVAGISGGPLVDRAGRLLGINTGSLVSLAGDDCVRSAGPSTPCLSLSVGIEGLRSGLGLNPPPSAHPPADAPGSSAHPRSR